MEQTVKVTLEPRGKFSIQLEDGQVVRGWFSLNALNRFCIAHGEMNYLQLVTKITSGMTIDDYADLLLMALQDMFRQDIKQCPWTVEKVMDDILEFMEPGTKPFLELYRHAIGRVVPLDIEGSEEDDKKK
jgi:hypothetical protein